ncbi:hypothetical protein F4778DRAFT_733060 [Xylariomycetidae sp. FL2044]|nr:hypothetical protein F4778DRAFT_733060 [Xylariomycetidae sp. FL2044]
MQIMALPTRNFSTTALPGSAFSDTDIELLPDDGFHSSLESFQLYPTPIQYHHSGLTPMEYFCTHFDDLEHFFVMGRRFLETVKDCAQVLKRSRQNDPYLRSIRPTAVVPGGNTLSSSSGSTTSSSIHEFCYWEDTHRKPPTSRNRALVTRCPTEADDTESSCSRVTLCHPHVLENTVSLDAATLGRCIKLYSFMYHPVYRPGEVGISQSLVLDGMDTATTRPAAGPDCRSGRLGGSNSSTATGKRKRREVKRVGFASQFACFFHLLWPAKFSLRFIEDPDDARRFNTCGGSGYKELRHLLEHLEKVHRRPQCTRYWKTFEASTIVEARQLLQAHQNAHNGIECPDLATEVIHVESIDGDVFSEVAKLLRPNDGNSEERWFKARNLILPPDRYPLFNPQSPYLTNSNADSPYAVTNGLDYIRTALCLAFDDQAQAEVAAGRIEHKDQFRIGREAYSTLVDTVINMCRTALPLTAPGPDPGIEDMLNMVDWAQFPELLNGTPGETVD